MPSITDEFNQVFVTYKDVKEAHPEWSDKAIEDYISIKRDLNTTAEEIDSTQDTQLVNPAMHAQLNELQQRIGSGDFLTCDDTGFTCDATVFTCDQDES